MSATSQRVLVTGGAGFIGSHLCAALLARGAKLAVVDHLDDFYAPAWKQASLDDLRRAGSFDFFPADICDASAMDKAFAAARPEIVVHLAARAGVRPSLEQPVLYERVNVGGTAVLLEACRRFGVGKLIFGSSSSVYGASSPVPFSEDFAGLHPISPYAATKLAGELACYTYAHLYALPVVALRFFTVYGPRQRPDLAIHKFTSLIEAGKPVPVFGDGSMGRDYTFVDDTVSGILAAMNYSPSSTVESSLATSHSPALSRPRADEGPLATSEPPLTTVPYEVFNLGNSHPVTLNDLLDALARATGRPVRREPHPHQPGDVPITWADISRARTRLGYNPKTRLDEGLAKFVAWFRSSPSRRLE